MAILTKRRCRLSKMTRFYPSIWKSVWVGLLFSVENGCGTISRCVWWMGGTGQEVRLSTTSETIKETITRQVIPRGKVVSLCVLFVFSPTLGCGAVIISPRLVGTWEMNFKQVSPPPGPHFVGGCWFLAFHFLPLFARVQIRLNWLGQIIIIFLLNDSKKTVETRCRNKNKGPSGRK